VSVPREQAWYQRALAYVVARHAGKTDPFGEPTWRHFERVASRLCARFPAASRAQVEAALVHDALEPDGVTPDALRAAGITEAAIALVRRITLPTDGRDYLQYVADLVASGDLAAIAVKLADNLDALDVYARLDGAAARDLLEHRYKPSRALLEAALAFDQAPGTAQ
jgi:(p)ppGpp synthase/HD superfamily hydrolase